MKNSSTLDIAAITISLCALGLTIYQGNETSKANSVSVHPHIDMTIIGGVGTDQDKGIRLDNAGNGPAIIDDFKLYVDGQEITGKKNELWWNTLLKLGFSGAEANGFRYIYLANTTTIKAGREFYLIKPNLNEEGKKRTLTDDELGKLNRLSIRVDYHGAFGDACYVYYIPANADSPFIRTTCIKI